MGAWLFDKDSAAAIFSCGGPMLSDSEKKFFHEAKPFGFILFARNIKDPQQVRRLIDDLKDSVGWDCPILVDQEGGRVQRMGPPHWRAYPPAKDFGDEARDSMDKALETIRFETMRMAEELLAAGINMTCAPVLDVLHEETHEVIGDRAFSSDPDIVARLGISVCRQYLATGIVPVIKHIPGHGRAAADSHLELPVVKASLEEMAADDFAPFRAAAESDIAPALWAMSAHVIYDSIDAEAPASVSKKVIDEIIRGTIGFDGVLVSDDLDMKALSGFGSVPERAALILEAGCDLSLYCAGDLAVMEKIAENTGKLGPETINRLQKAAEFRKVAPSQKVSSRA